MFRAHKAVLPGDRQPRRSRSTGRPLLARQNYYKAKRTSPTQLRRQWLTGLIREVHVASGATYGYRRIHAELTMAMGIKVCPRPVSVLMTLAGIRGLPASARRTCAVW